MLNQTFNNLPEIMSANDLLRILPLSRSGIYQMINEDGFPVIKMGKRKLIPKEEFLFWLSNNINPSYRVFRLEVQSSQNNQNDWLYLLQTTIWAKTLTRLYYLYKNLGNLYFLVLKLTDSPDYTDLF